MSDILDVGEFLHQRFNRRSDQVSPVRIINFTREKMYQLFAELDFKVGAEIGVDRGKNSLSIFQNIPDLKKLYCIDPWENYQDNHWAHGDQDEAFSEAVTRLESYMDDYPNYIEFIKDKSEKVASSFEPDELDFVYIDGNHAYDYVMLDLILWSRIVRPGGIVAGHDYYRFRNAGVVDAVNHYTFAHQIHEFFVTDEKKCLSFFWAKPGKPKKRKCKKKKDKKPR
jgi:predicted O-methyltransferase YrrM